MPGRAVNGLLGSRRQTLAAMRARRRVGSRDREVRAQLAGAPNDGLFALLGRRQQQWQAQAAG